MRTSRLALVVTIVACEAANGPASEPAEDAAMGAANATSSAAAPAADPAAPAPCAVAKPRGTYVEYTLTLQELCTLLAEDGRITCPTNRRAAVQSSINCSKEGYFPTMRRLCGVDQLDIYSPSFARVVWTFDAGTGALIAARVNGAELACGHGAYVAGPQDTSCSGALVECRLCEGGPERDAECPADVVAVLPSKACEAPSVVPGCACANPGRPSVDLPPPGGPCGAPTTCPRCQSGTCWATCVCGLDGLSRWSVGCTE